MDTIELPGIPAWLPWAQALVRGLVAFLVSWAGAALAQRCALGPYRKAKGAHWAEAARLLLPARRVAVYAFVLFPIVFGYGAYLLVGGVPYEARLLTVSAASFGAIFGVIRGHKALGDAISDDGRRRPRLRERLASFLATTLVLYPVLVVAFAFMAFLPSTLGLAGAVWALSFGAAIYLVVRGAGLKIAGFCGLVHEPSTELRLMMEELSGKMGQGSVTFVEVAMLQVNAFAMPQLKLVAVTKGLVEKLTPAQIRAVCAHELGHIAEKSTVVRARLGLIWAVYLVLVGVYVMGALGIEPLVQILVAAGLFVLKAALLGRFLRQAEKHADDHAHEHEGDDGTYAHALEAIYRANRVPAVLGGAGSTHPHLYDRMVAAGVTPDFPRPLPPTNGRARVAMAIIAVVAGLALMTSEFVPLMLQTSTASRAQLVGTMAYTGPTEGGLTYLGNLAYKEKDYDAAARLYQAAAARRPDSPRPKLNAALALAKAERCHDASVILSEATWDLTDGAVDERWLSDIQLAVYTCDPSNLGH